MPVIGRRSAPSWVYEAEHELVLATVRGQPLFLITADKALGHGIIASHRHP